MISKYAKKIVGALLLSILPVLAGINFPRLYCASQLDNQMYVNLRNIAQAFERSGQIEEAILLLTPHREDPKVLTLLSGLYAKSGKKEELLEVTREVFAKNPDNRQVLASYLTALNWMGFRDSIRIAVSAFLERAEEREATYMFTGGQLRQYGMFEDALDVYQKGRKELGRGEIFSREMAQVLIDLKRYEQALDELVVFLKARPGETGLAQREAYRVMDIGKSGTELIFKRLGKALENSEGLFRVSLLKLLVDLNLSANRSEKAFSRLGELLGEVEKKEAYRQLTVFIGRCFKIKQFESALAAYNLADSLELMDKGLVFLNKSSVLLRMEKYEQVESSLLQLVSSDKLPANIRVEAMKRLGDLYLDRLHRPDEALRWFREVEKLDQARGKLLFDAKEKIVESFIRRA